MANEPSMEQQVQELRQQIVDLQLQALVEHSVMGYLLAVDALKSADPQTRILQSTAQLMGKADQIARAAGAATRPMTEAMERICDIADSIVASNSSS